MRRWTQDDFDSMSWHDNHVHGLRIAAGAHGAGEVELDIDYILEWLKPADGSYRFRIAPAKLRFLDVTNLRITVDYAVVSAAIGPFSLSGIERTYQQRKRYVAVCWKLLANFPPGEITLEAPGFEQTLVGPDVIADRQWLDPAERVGGRRDR